MNEFAPESLGWRPRRWLVFVVLLIAAQLAVVWCLSVRRSPPAPRVSAEAHLRVVGDGNKEGARRPTFEHADPTLFALVSAEGFSGPAWLTIPDFAYTMSNGPAPLQWLAVRPEELADDLTEFVQTNLLSEDVIAGPITPQVAEPAQRVPVLTAATLLKVEGELADRPLLYNPPLPQLSEPVLTNTTVRLLVDGDGRTVSAALLSPSWVAAADQAALRFARGARFAPRRSTVEGDPGKKCDFGTFVFQWARLRWDVPPTLTAQR
jgi:hypothetical protein